MINNQTHSNEIKKGRGGRRPGAGRKLGVVTEATKAKRRAEATLKEMAAQHTPEALQTLVDLMKDEGVPAAARVAAVKEILDRAHGKATQTIAGDPENPIPTVTRVELIAALNDSED